MKTSQSGESALLLLDVVNLLREQKAQYAVIGALAASVHGALLRLRDRHDNRVDLLIGLRGMEPKAFSRLLEVPFQGEVLRFIGRKDFIAMKAFAGGPLDLIDAARAISAAGDSLDLELVRRLAKSYGAAAAASLDRLLKR
jgi:hypothetical protein